MQPLYKYHDLMHERPLKHGAINKLNIGQIMENEFYSPVYQQFRNHERQIDHDNDVRLNVLFDIIDRGHK